jgi:hypothetical protein
MRVYYGPDADGDAGSGGDSDSGADGGAVENGGVIEYGGKMLTMEEAKQALERADEKEKGADEKFRQAAEMRKQNDSEYQQLWQDLSRVNQGDVEAAKRVLQSGKAVEIGIEQHLKAFVDSGGQVPAAGDEEMVEEQQGPLEIEDMPAEVQQSVQKQQWEERERLKTTIHKALDEFLDGDELIGDIMRSEAGIVKHARNVAREALKRRAQEAARMGDRLWKPTDRRVLTDVAQEVRAYLKDADWLGDTEDGKVVRTHPSAGRTGTPAGSKLHQVQEVPERPSSRNTGDYSNYLHALLQEQQRND